MSKKSVWIAVLAIVLYLACVCSAIYYYRDFWREQICPQSDNNATVVVLEDTCEDTTLMLITHEEGKAYAFHRGRRCVTMINGAPYISITPESR